VTSQGGLENQLITYDSSNRQDSIFHLFRYSWTNRSLLFLLIKKDITLRYRRSVLGIWWSLLNPILTSTVLFFVFNTVFKSKVEENMPFVPYVFSGVILITLFSQAINLGADSIQANSGIFTKIYVKPELFCFSTIIVTSINFLVALIPLGFAAHLSEKNLDFKVLLIFPFLLCYVFFLTGLSLMTSILYIFFEDMRSIISILLMLTIYLTPVFYPITALGVHTRYIVKLNPLTEFLFVFRAIFANIDKASFQDYIAVFASSTVVFTIGVVLFRRFWNRALIRL